jgi:hypothetical protein
MVDLNTIVKRKDSVISAGLEGNAVMMSIENGRYYGLNEIATDIWESLDTPISVSKLVSKLTEKYDVTKEQCEESVIAFLARLSSENIIDIN